MESTFLIQVTNPKAIQLLRGLEELSLIKVLKETITTPTTKLSQKYKNTFTAEDGTSFNDHVQKMRNEWEGDI
jgi:hypothetical protein